MEHAGAIRGYRAVVHPAAIGLGFEFLVHATMDREDAAVIATFESGLAKVTEVRDSKRLRRPRVPRPRSHRRHSRLSEPLFADISGPPQRRGRSPTRPGYSRDSPLPTRVLRWTARPSLGQGRAHTATSLPLETERLHGRGWRLFAAVNSPRLRFPVAVCESRRRSPPRRSFVHFPRISSGAGVGVRAG
jgi:hypothetical protein